MQGVGEDEREAMGRLVRRRMLEALKNPPPDVGAPLTAAERSKNLFGLALIFAFNLFVYRLLVATKTPMKTLLLWFAGASTVLTLVLWFYAVHVQFWFFTKASSKKRD